MASNIVFRNRVWEESYEGKLRQSKRNISGKNPAYHLKTKHIDVQYHFVINMVESNKELLEKVDTLETIIDSLTKYVSVVKFSWCREVMGIASLGM
jgi:hypothetical protein